MHSVSSKRAEARTDQYLVDTDRRTDDQHASGDRSDSAVVRATTVSGHCLLGSQLAVLIPCFIEEATIGVVEDFRAQFPETEVFVSGNNSTAASLRSPATMAPR